MRIGCCVNMLAGPSEPVGMQYISLLKELGYSYVELPLAEVTALSEEEFQGLLRMMGDNRLSCECCNNFFPADVRLTGPHVSPAKQKEFIARAMARAARMGAEIVVFGSSRAKNLPEGFDSEEGMNQVAQVMELVLPYAENVGISIAVEPLCRKESNLIRDIGEGMELIHRLGSPERMGLVVDYYHFSKENESLSVLEEIKSKIIHLHFADPVERMCPKKHLPDYDTFFEVISNLGYTGRVSLEAYAENPPDDLKQALSCLSRYT